MIDTIRFYNPEFVVGKKAKLQKKASFYENSNEKEVLYRQDIEVDNFEGFNLIKADTAFINDMENGIYLTIKSIPKQKPICGIQCSIPKVLYGKNYIDYEPDDYTLFLDTIYSWQEKNDIHFNVEDSKISRLDNSFNCITDNNINNYFQIFKSINMSRLQKFDYGSTFLFKNSRRQVTVYDKFSEQLAFAPVSKSNKYDYVKNKYPDLSENNLRFEYRLLKSSVIEKKIKDIDSPEIKDNYLFALEQFFNLVDSSEKNLNIDDIFSSLKEYQNYSDRKFFDNFLSDYAIIKLAETMDISDLINFVDKMELKPYKKSRIKKQLRDTSKMKLKNTTLEKLADELKNKIEMEIKKHD